MNHQLDRLLEVRSELIEARAVLDDMPARIICECQQGNDRAAAEFRKTLVTATANYAAALEKYCAVLQSN